VQHGYAENIPFRFGIIQVQGGLFPFVPVGLPRHGSYVSALFITYVNDFRPVCRKKVHLLRECKEFLVFADRIVIPGCDKGENTLGNIIEDASRLLLEGLSEGGEE
jgi:hypothetical protein